MAKRGVIIQRYADDVAAAAGRYETWESSCPWQQGLLEWSETSADNTQPPSKITMLLPAPDRILSWDYRRPIWYGDVPSTIGRGVKLLFDEVRLNRSTGQVVHLLVWQALADQARSVWKILAADFLEREASQSDRQVRAKPYFE